MSESNDVNRDIPQPAMPFAGGGTPCGVSEFQEAQSERERPLMELSPEDRERAQRRVVQALEIAENGGDVEQWFKNILANEPLIRAAERGDTDAVKSCLAEGADINGTNDEGWTAL